MEEGNMAAMRKALVLIANTAECLEASLKRDNVWDGHIQAVCNIIEVARHTLAKPPHEAKWTANGGYEFACCSSCGHLQYTGWDSRAEQSDKIGDFHELYKFCPNCGAQMKGETDGSK